jgi:hypothetical protein
MPAAAFTNGCEGVLIMAIRYDICQSQGCVQSPVARAWVEVMFNTLGEVPRSDDPTGGGLYKAVQALDMNGMQKHGVPVFVMEENAPAESPADGYRYHAIDVSWKANHYRVHFRTKGGPWKAYKIMTLAPMYYFNKASTDLAASQARTGLLTRNLANQFQAAAQGRALAQD